MRPNEITEVLNRPISQELLARDITRVAYVAKDGTPRNVPIAFAWNGSTIVMCTAKNAAKLWALSENPMVAMTIDTEAHPPKILLIRGRAELDFVDGIPDEYLQPTSTYGMTPEQRVEWEAEVRSLYHERMPTSTTGPAGPTGSAGAAGLNGISGYEVIETALTAFQFVGGSTWILDLRAVCPAGKLAIGGGHHSLSAESTIFMSQPEEVSIADVLRSSWHIRVRNSYGPIDGRAYAVCATVS
jgi:hypothetical protein